MSAGVGDVDVAGGGAGGAVDSDEGGGFETAGSVERGSRLTGVAGVFGADVAARWFRIDFLAEHEEEFAGRAELLDAVVGGVGDVEVAGGGAEGVIDGDVGGVGEGVGAGAGDGGFEAVADDLGERRGGSEGERTAEVAMDGGRARARSLGAAGWRARGVGRWPLHPSRLCGCW